VNILWAGKHCERLCGDLLVVHLRKCTLGKMETLSHQPVGKVVQPLQSVNCHDSSAHGHERHRPFTPLVGIWWDGSGRVTGSSWFGSWNAAGEKPVCMVLGLAIGGMSASSIGLATGGVSVCSVGLATGGMHVSSVGFGYRWDACERWSVWLQV
jgi:hypothetical protein